MKRKILMSEFTKITSKGQIVIPAEIRRRVGAEEGSIFAVTGNKNLIVLKKMDRGMTEEDVEILKDILEAEEDLQKGRYKVYSAKDFLREIEKW